MKYLSLGLAVALAVFVPPAGWHVHPAGRQVPPDTFPMSTALSPDGRYLLVLNSGYNPPSISVIELATTREIGRTPVPDGWLGLTFSPKGDRVYVGGGARAAVFEFTFSQGKLQPAHTFAVGEFVGDVALSPDGRLLYAAMLFRDTIAVVNPRSGVVIDRFHTGRRPYRILFDPDGKSYFVSSWTDGSVYQHQTDNGALLARLQLGLHPTDMVWRGNRLFVASANTNNVYVVGVSEGKELSRLEAINISMTPRHPAGMTPSALALSADRKRLFVACSDANAVAVIDVTEPESRLMGFVPVGWYPTALRSLPDGRLLVVNGKGAPAGTASFIDPFDESALVDYTKTVLDNAPYRDALLEDAGMPKGNPVPTFPGDPSPIEHVIYILNEGYSTAGNRQKLAREFAQLDNFHPNSEGGRDAQYWATAAIVPDFVEKLLPSRYNYPETDPTAAPPAGYLWTSAAGANLSIRNYGCFVMNRPKPDATGMQVAAVRDPVLNKVTNLRYRGSDPDYPDAERIKVFLSDLAEFEKAGSLPRLIILRLGNDRTSDHALGLLVESVSRSKFWPNTAIFAPALVISPYVKRHDVDRTVYDTTSMLRTIELILGLRPMTHFDAGARPMFALFQDKADDTPYVAVKP